MWQALDLPCDMFMLCYKNWTVEKLMQTEDGRQYLDDCKRLSQTKMDKEGLRRLMGAVQERSGVKKNGTA